MGVKYGGEELSVLENNMMGVQYFIERKHDSRYLVFFFQAEDGIRDLVRSRGLRNVYKRPPLHPVMSQEWYSTSHES